MNLSNQCVLNIAIPYYWLCVVYDRSNSLNFLLGKNGGSIELLMPGRLKWNGWLKVK